MEHEEQVLSHRVAFVKELGDELAIPLVPCRCRPLRQMPDGPAQPDRPSPLWATAARHTCELSSAGPERRLATF